MLRFNVMMQSICSIVASSDIPTLISLNGSCISFILHFPGAVAGSWFDPSRLVAYGEDEGDEEVSGGFIII